MSIAEFSAGMKSHALKAFRTAKIGNDYSNPLFYAISKNEKIRKIEQEKGKTNFIISKSSIEQIRNILVEDYPNLPKTSDLLNRAKEINNSFTKPPAVRIVKTPSGSRETVLVYEGVEFVQGIDSILKEIFDTGKESSNTHIRNTLVGQSGIFQKGHVVGIATNALAQAAEDNALLLTKSTNAAVKAIDIMISDLRNYDISTSNFKSESTYNMLGDYIKSPNQYVVELQVKVDNTLAGGKVGRDLANLRSIFKHTEEDIAGELIKQFREDSLFSQSIINMKGSPSMLQLIEASVLEALDPIGHPKTKKTFLAKNIPIAQFTNKITVNKDKLKQSLQKEIRKLEQLKVKIARDAKGRARSQKGQFASIANIQILLNARLADQIKQNMGSGDRKDILNLRSGRFAETVQIERLNLQRDNVLAVFYSYMKYPYATFSSGGEQSFPNSRDPVTLINKSIREIASTLVTNRLRMFNI